MTSLLLFGPLMVAANLAAQQVPFNAIFLVSDPAQKWRLFANFLLYLLPVPGRRLLPRHGLPQGAADFRPRLFRRPHRLGPVRAPVPAAPCTSSRPRTASIVPLRAVAGRQRAVVRGRRRSARPIAWHRGRRGCWLRRRAPGGAGASASPSSRSRTTRAWPTRASSPTRSASTSAPRRSAIWRSIPAPTCISRRACPTTPRSTCRPCRPTPISASTSTARARAASSATCRPTRPPISATCR